MRLLVCLSFSIALIGAVPAASAEIISGPISNLDEATTPFRWGTPGHELVQTWSVRNATSGYVYGPTGGSNTHVHVIAGLSSPIGIGRAESFAYTSTTQQFAEGDTIFFRGPDGYYGAWSVDDIIAPPGFTGADLYGRWYFQTDGTGNFTVPEPTSALVTLAAGCLFVRRRRQVLGHVTPAAASRADA